MENKKEPLMSAGDFYDAIIDMSNIPREHWQNEIIDFMDNYAKYYTQWHLNNAKEFVADGIKYNHTCNDGKGCGIPYCDSLCGNIDKQSIHTAIDNYIEINLNKEL